MDRVCVEFGVILDSTWMLLEAFEFIAIVRVGFASLLLLHVEGVYFTWLFNSRDRALWLLEFCLHSA